MGIPRVAALAASRQPNVHSVVHAVKYLGRELDAQCRPKAVHWELLVLDGAPLRLLAKTHD